MAIALTWNNIFVLVGLCVVLLTALSSGTAAVMQWQLSSVDSRLNDRISIYHRDQEGFQRELNRIEDRLSKLEQRP